MNSRVMITVRPVTSPARGVAAPVSLLTAERLKDPVAGYALKPPPMRLAMPSARSSWLAWISYLCFAARARAIEMDSISPTTAHRMAVVMSPPTLSPSSGVHREKVSPGRPEGNLPTTSTMSSRPAP